jgi:hypothetical protein
MLLKSTPKLSIRCYMTDFLLDSKLFINTLQCNGMNSQYHHHHYYSSFHWNTGPQQLYETVAEVSVVFKFLIETGLLALCSNPQPGGPGLHIYIPWRLGGPVIPPGSGYPF